MADIKKTVATFNKFLSEDGKTAHFLYVPGAPPHIEFAATKIKVTGAADLIGMAERQDGALYLSPKKTGALKSTDLRELAKALKVKFPKMEVLLGAASPPQAEQQPSQDDDDDDRSEDTSDGKARATSDKGDPQVAKVIKRIREAPDKLLQRKDLPPNLSKIQDALNQAVKTQKGNPKMLVQAFQRLRAAAMAFDLEREAEQTADTGEYGNIPTGQQNIDADDHGPLPATPEEAGGDYGNIPTGLNPEVDDLGALPPTPGEADADYGDLPVSEGKSDTGYDGTYQDLEMVPKPDGTDDDDASSDSEKDPYDKVTSADMEAYAKQKAETIDEFEDRFRDTIEAPFNKLHDRLDGTSYARGTVKYAALTTAMSRFRDMAEKPNAKVSDLAFLLRKLSEAIVAIIKEVKAKSAR